MRKKIYLYIGGKQVDTGEDSFILFNFEQEDLSNPTVVKNPYTQQVTLPRTDTNNQVFGEFWRLDRLSTLSSSSYTGANYNALQRTPFTIYNDCNEILQKGYAKLEEVTSDSYKVSLYGELGRILYTLDMDDDGNKLTLADIIYVNKYDHDTHSPYTTQIFLNAAGMKDNWSCMLQEYAYETPEPTTAMGKWAYIFGFAPCDNGYPDSSTFDCSHGVIQAGSYSDAPIPVTITDGDDPGTYYPVNYSTNSNVIVDLKEKLTEWQVRDFRYYLQRPVVNLAEMMKAIEVMWSQYIELGTWVDEDYYHSIWITLPMMSTSGATYLSDILETSLSPAEYILAAVKTFGLVLNYNGETGKIRILGRNEWYDDSTLNDINDRIDRTTLTSKPFLIQSRRLEMSFAGQGKFCDDYRDKYSVEFGRQSIDTNFAMSTDTLQLFEDSNIKGAAEVLNTGKYYVFGWCDTYQHEGYNAGWGNFPVPPTYRLYYNGIAGGTQVDVPFNYRYATAANELYSGYGVEVQTAQDIAPHLQFRDKEGKPTDGSNVFIFLTGAKRNTQDPTSTYAARYHLSDDDDDVTTLNGGLPCWDLRFTSSDDYFLIPIFRLLRNNDYLTFGVPREVAVPDMPDDPDTIYSKKWQVYLQDRYDKDTRVVTCKVNLEGMQVNQDLLRKFWWFDNAVWVLNAIRNYSLTTMDCTECEFVKVQDVTDYTNGQES